MRKPKQKPVRFLFNIEARRYKCTNRPHMATVAIYDYPDNEENVRRWMIGFLYKQGWLIKSISPNYDFPEELAEKLPPLPHTPGYFKDVGV